jgi:hypothetical protein
MTRKAPIQRQMFRKGFLQYSKKGTCRVEFLKLGTRKIVLKYNQDAKAIKADSKKKEDKKD